MGQVPDLPRRNVAHGQVGNLPYRALTVILLVLAASCASRSGPPAIGFAYTAPATLNLRSELASQAPTTATLRHGERVEILETRRRFVRVRAANGAVGWTDSVLLLTQGQMDDLKALADQAAAIPSQGTATVFDALNVHTAASRSAPTILQLQKGDRVEIVAHTVSERTAAEAPKSVAFEKQGSETPPAVPPARPGNPSSAPPPSPPPAPPPADDWFLVRTPQGRAGWVLMRAVLMQVPDEVAQYAERQWITSYHSLGASSGGGKNHWLWTTMARGLQPYDFDSFRVFVYNPRRQRYETVLIERNLKGHFPVATSAAPDGTTFSVLVDERDGQLYKRTYLFKEMRARMVSKAPASLPEPLPDVRPAKAFDAVASDDGGWLKRLAKKWFGP